MVFSSLPAYLDPANWQQQPNHHLFHQAPGVANHQQLIITSPPQTAPPPPSAQPQVGGGVGSPSSIRPGSMAERARQANIPMPEGPLKCPRCDSTNTKFCYFNNYNLTQPRHFCKTCRRYWTRGGALRNVPVGGGCRRNKRTKSTSSNSNNKSPISNDRQGTSSSTSTLSSHNTGLLQATHANNIFSGLSPQLPPLRFMSPLGQFTDNYNSSGDIGLNFSGISTPLVGGTSEMNNFQIGRNLLSGGGGIEQWRLQQQAQQFPFLSGLDAPQSAAGIYPFQLGGSGGGGDPQSRFLGEASHHQQYPHNQVRPNKLSASFLSQLGSVKMEDCNTTAVGGGAALSLSRQFLGMNNAITADQTDQEWNNTTININNNNNNNNNTNSAWTDLSSFSSSSTSNNPI